MNCSLDGGVQSAKDLLISEGGGEALVIINAWAENAKRCGLLVLVAENGMREELLKLGIM